MAGNAPSGVSTFSPTKFFQPPEQAAPSTVPSFVDEEDHGWTASFQQTIASIAITAVLAVSFSANVAQYAGSQHQDDPAGSLTATADETYQLLPTIHIQYQAQQNLADDPVIVPQPVVFQPDEDYFLNPVQTFAVPNVLPQLWTFEEQYPFLHGAFDEDFWQNPNQTTSLIHVQPLIFDDQFVPQPVSGIVDEDFFIPFIAYVPLTGCGTNWSSKMSGCT
jgi:hypothetical protein